MMKSLLSFSLLFFTISSYGQKKANYLTSFVDSTSGPVLIGFKSITGKVVIKPRFSSTYTDTLYFMAIVLSDDQWIGINKQGKTILTTFIYDNGPDYVKEGLFRFVENNKIGFANLNGRKIITAQFEFATPFNNGLSEYTLGGHRQNDKSGEHWYWTGGYENGYINQVGQRFKKVTELKNGTRRAWTKDGKLYILNESGQVIH